MHFLKLENKILSDLKYKLTVSFFLPYMKSESSVEFLFDSYLKELLFIESLIKCIFCEASVMRMVFLYIALFCAIKSQTSFKKCMLSLREKYHIIFSTKNLLNKNELVAKCRHENKLYLVNYKDIPP